MEMIYTVTLNPALDKELHASGGTPTEQSEAYFDELTEIFHAQNAEPSVAPPSLKNLRRLVRDTHGGE